VSRILIIDDNAMNLDIAKDLLQHAGFKTLEAEDAETGIRLMKETKPDLVLLDLLMPRVDGFEAMRTIQADPEIQDIPVVAFTALASQEDQTKALKSGCRGIIVKPIDASIFIPTIQSYLNGQPASLPTFQSEALEFKSVKTIMRSTISKSHTILIVDDNPMNLDILKEAVLVLDQVPITVESGEQALRLIQEHKPDLILLDIMMPGMHGYAVMDALKASPETADIPIIIISALDHTEDRVKGLLQGGCDYISKPFELQEVQARIAVALRMKDLQDQLKQERDELATMNQELDHFTTVVSHDMQAPLRKIHIFAEQVRTSSHSQLCEEDQDILQRICCSTTRMQNLIWDLLALSRARYKRKEPKPTNLTRLIYEILADLKETIQQTNAQIEVSEMPVIEADETQIRQMIYNLISNAIKFHQEGKPPRINIYAKTIDQEKIQLVVEDNGIGFSEEYAERIFKPFERLHGVTQYPGTGIGLAICKKVAERHGGKIIAKSAVNAGATFMVQLPVKQAVEVSA
jgi:two-component system, sensor histidine kinase and response regulator